MDDTKNRTPPPLPPRSETCLPIRTITNSSTLPLSEQEAPERWLSSDPRSSSTQSLVPCESHQEGRRRLLLIYVHGFMGSETSFASFPSHVHNLVTLLLADSHVIHTKMYPRYKSRRPLSFARDDFSNWIAPHMSSSTDVILLGHSMGGLLTAEVVLMPPIDPSRVGRSLQHRIVGTINFDVPFLGIHHGVIRAGLGSLFRRKQEKGETPPVLEPAIDIDDSVSESTATSASESTAAISTPARENTLFATTTNESDPNFNAPFFNDVILPVRKGWSSTVHFFNKHSENLSQGIRRYVTSHAEFGGTMADYPALHRRYDRLRALDDEDERRRRVALGAAVRAPRVRFVNYYTASSGRPKRRSPSASVAGARKESMSSTLAVPSPNDAAGASTTPIQTPPRSPRIRVEEYQDGVLQPVTRVEPIESSAIEESIVTADENQAADGIALLPASAMEALPSGLESSTESRPAGGKTISQAVQSSDLHDKQSQSLAGSNTSDPLESGHDVPGLHQPDQPSPPSKDQPPTPSVPDPAEGQPKKPRKDRRFCVRPGAITITLPDGTRATGPDPTWVRVYMRGVDEVEAHCGLFDPHSTDQSRADDATEGVEPDEGPDRHYERLVGDVSERIERWVREAEGERVAWGIDG